jgi:LuxR family maltose regulon positive regulatory protein
MSTSLLTTKLYIPPARSELVSRPRLIARLDEGLRSGRKLTLISATAGFGKTTLLSAWVGARQALRQKVAWLSLDEGDNDPARLWRYVIAALQIVNHQIGKTMQGALQSPQPPSPESLVTTLINDIADAVDATDGPLTLVLDDYHVIEAESIHQSLDFLLDHLPPELHLVIATREDPPLALPRLRGRGQVTEIRAVDLRFTAEEAAQFLNACMGLGLSAEDIATLENRTEGWIVGLQMAALALQGLSQRGRADQRDFVAAFAGDDRYVGDYLIEEVLRHQSPHTQSFLLQTSVLERLCGPLCDAVTGQEGCRATLHELEKANLFLVPLDNSRHWYRYHRLFADLLRSRLDEAHPDQVPDLHRRASAWCEQEGFMPEAVSHALAAPDYERAADLIEQHGLALMAKGEPALARRWLEALPQDAFHSRPLLCMGRAWTTLTDSQSIESAERWMQKAESLAAARPHEPGWGDPYSTVHDLVAANAAAFRVSLARVRGDSPEKVVEAAQQALDHLPEGETILRGAVAFWLGDAHARLGDGEAADRAFALARQMGKATEGHVAALAAISNQAYEAWSRGRLRDLAEMCRDALSSLVEPAERKGQRVPMACGIYVPLGRVLLAWNRLAEAEPALAQGTELAGLCQEREVQVGGYRELAHLCCAQGRFQEALAMLDEVEPLCTWAPLMIPAHRARVWLAQAEQDPRYLDLSIKWADGHELENPGYYSHWLLSLAWVRIAQYRAYGQPDLEPIIHILDEQLQLAEEADAIGWRIDALLPQALALQALGKVGQAMGPLERALRLAEPEGFVINFLDHRVPMAALLQEAARRGIAVEYANKLLAAFDASGYRDVGKPSPLPSAPSLLEPLTERELEVLRLLATRLSGPEIAERLVISLSTLRSHTKSIYGKLNVHRRADAVECAEELGLI